MTVPAYSRVRPENNLERERDFGVARPQRKPGPDARLLDLVELEPVCDHRHVVGERHVLVVRLAAQVRELGVELSSLRRGRRVRPVKPNLQGKSKKSDSEGRITSSVKRCDSFIKSRQVRFYE